MKEIDESVKIRIADLWQNTTMSIGSIASALNVSNFTVQKYKNLEITIQKKII
jgi:transposase